VTGPARSAEPVDHVVIGLGALGSAAAWALARRGEQVVGLEQFPLGHQRGASHDTSRILRRSYHSPAYVRLADQAYADWSELSALTGEDLVTVTGGLDFFPPDAAIEIDGYTSSMEVNRVPFTRLTDVEVSARWPVISLPDGTTVVHQADTGIVPAARATASLQRLARTAEARLYGGCPVTGLVDHGDHGVEVHTADASYLARRVVITADAWTNDLLAHLDATLPLTVTREQVTYFAPEEPERFAPDRLPVWIWMDNPSFYGFPTYGEPTVKVGQDCGGAVVTADSRTFDPDVDGVRRVSRFVTGLLPGAGQPLRTVTCLYTLTPDRDFVIGAVPEHPGVLVGLGAGHGFKFAPTIGRVLADLATEGTAPVDIAAFAPDRPALVDAGHPVRWLV